VPKVSARYTAYQLEDQPVGDPGSPDRFLPIFSLDSGLVFERPTSWFGEGATQTLEPRLFYLYTPDENQDDLPVFDTVAYGSSLDNLFRENRFSGADRQGDANQLTTVLTTRYLSEESGREWLKASLGQILYFDDRNVQLPGVAVERDNTSSLVGEVSSNIAQYWYTRAYLQWDPHNNNVEKGSAEVRYNDGESRIFNLAYRYEELVQDQLDTSFSWPVDNSWNLVGRWNYSLRHDKNLDVLAGVEYDSCCWAFRFVGRHFANDVDGDDSTTGIFLQLELKGLGSLGQKADRVIEQGVLGYKVKR